MMDQKDAVDERIREFAEGALAALTPERRAECELLSRAEPGLRLRPAEDDPEIAELLYGGAVIARASWAWLNTGQVAP